MYWKTEYVFAWGLLVMTSVGDAQAGSAAAKKEDKNSHAANAVAALGVDMLAQISGPAKNVFFSPYSITSCFALVTTGARGETQSALLRALHGGTDAGGFFSEMARTRTMLTQAPGAATLEMASGLWLQEDAGLNENFVDAARDEYQAEIRRVDFKHAAEIIRLEVNRWVAEKTADKIQNILAPGTVDSSSRLVIADAIYFKGKWAQPFAASSTTAQPFLTGAGKSTNPPTMHLTKKFRYLQAKDFRALELPYAESGLSLVVILPEAADQTEKFFHDFSSEKLILALAELDFSGEQTVAVSLPKFKVETTINLVAAMSALGAARAFQYPAADFSGIGKQLYISAATQKAYVAVDEAGTEAAAATVVTMRMGSAMQRNRAEFKADHPFLVLIRENTSGIILFLGRISDPHFSEN